MGFFKDFKEDISQAMNELLPEEEANEEEAKEQLVDALDFGEIVLDEVSDSGRMKEWLEEFAQDEAEKLDARAIQDEDADQTETDIEEHAFELEEEEGEDMDDNVDLELLEAMNAEDEAGNEAEVKEKTAVKVRTASVVSDDDVTVITKGTTINGSISSDGSLEINGTITGDVECLGKLSITGKIKGNSSAAEIYVNTERLEGSITSEGSVKVGLGTVVIGDVVGTSGVIAGAIKGEIDINGPIVIDSTAIIKGNIKAKSVQINNGAVIEGFCSLSYSAVDVDNVFE
jgi:cytoskeletal protein CcmA (bactofilin family)